jgi:hypothetical protein
MSESQGFVGLFKRHKLYSTVIDLVMLVWFLGSFYVVILFEVLVLRSSGSFFLHSLLALQMKKGLSMLCLRSCEAGS